MTALVNTDRAALVVGDYATALSGVRSVGALISDPPFSSRTHEGHNAGEQYDDAKRRALSYTAWTPDDVAAFVRSWSPRTDGWFVAMTDHVLWPVYEAELARDGRCTFAPVPLVIRGMTVRRQGDGPSSWVIWICVARPRSREFMGGWTRDGAYVGGRGPRGNHIGGKPLWAMAKLVRDYTRPTDVVVDPCAGFATTGVAALGLGRRFVGAEVDPTTAAIAAAELAAGHHGAHVVGRALAAVDGAATSGRADEPHATT